MKTSWGGTSSSLQDVPDDSSNRDGDTAPSPKQRRLSACAMCCSAGRYRCPRCSVVTCCLNCSRLHKEQSECSGLRHRTGYAPIGVLNDTILTSDLHFLQEVCRARDIARREEPPPILLPPKSLFTPQIPTCSTVVSEDDRKANNGTTLSSSSQPLHGLPKHLRKLVMAAKSRGTLLVLLPMGMSRRRLNTTRLDGRLKRMFWKTEWMFQFKNMSIFNGNHESPVVLSNPRTDELLTPAEILSCYLVPSPENASTIALLEPYAKAVQIQSNPSGADGHLPSSSPLLIDPKCASIRIFLKVEPCCANSPLYHPISLGQSLQTSLANITVIEFPTFIVALDSEWSGLPACSCCI